MRLIGSGGQAVMLPGYRMDGATESTTLPKLILPAFAPRSSLIIQNCSVNLMWFEFGQARATAVLTNGVVTSLTITNGGFGYTKAPTVRFLGGGYNGNTSFLGLGIPDQPSPQRPAKATATVAGGAVTGFTIEDGGASYACAPYVLMTAGLDPNGCADPSAGGGSGFQLYPGQSLTINGTVTATDPVAVFCAATGQKYFCQFTA